MQSRRPLLSLWVLCLWCVQESSASYDGLVCCTTEGKACCLQNCLVGDYSFAAAFANDAYVDRKSGDTVELANAFENTTAICEHGKAEVVQFFRAERSLGR
jgi:hypothetical protein